MPALFDHLMFNAAAAAVLAPLAFATRWAGRPALTHAAWLIVLLRLVMPPLGLWNLTWPVTAPAIANVELFESPQNVVLEETEAPVVLPMLVPEQIVFETPPITPAWTTWNVIVIAWLGVTGLMIGLLALQALAVTRWIRSSRGASPQLLHLVGTLCRRLGLRSPPRVRVTHKRISPCVLGVVGRPVLLLPEGWLDGLDRLQQAAVLVHELAHLRRKDHWMRWLEAAVSVPFWWHPAVWVARRELRDAEELCCDGWVIATLPAARRAYADALVDTVDFLATARPVLPPLASGIGEIRELKRRLHMILRTNPAHRPGRAGAAIALGLGLLLLPAGMARSDDDTPPPPPPPNRRGDRDNEDAPPRPPRPPESRRDQQPAGSADQKAQIDELRAALNRAQRRLEESRHEVERIHNALAQLTGERATRERTPEQPRATERRIDPARAEALREKELDYARSMETPRPSRPVEPRTPTPPVAPVPGNPNPFFGPGNAGGRPGAPPARGGNDSDRRVEMLEKQLELIRNELREMRKEMQRKSEQRP